MKRFAAGVVAAATALSLSTGVASAQTEGDWEDLGTLIGAAVIGEVNGYSQPHKASTETSSDAINDMDSDAARGSAKAHVDFNTSSWQNDAKNGYALGTTADILWGLGIAAAILGAAYTAVQNGLVPGVSLPF